MNKIKKPPLALGGLSLSLFALGNALGEYSQTIHALLGGIAFIIYLVLLSALIRHFKTYRKELQHPISASIFPTVFMQGMLLITYAVILPTNSGIVLYNISKGIWWLSFISQFLYIILFSFQFLRNFKLNNVFPSWAVLYLGIGIVSLTSPSTGYYNLGKIVFWYLLTATFALLPIVFFRLYKLGIPKTVRANIATLCAPSLLVVAYLNAFENVNKLFLLFLIIIAQLLYFSVLYHLPNLIKDNFTPGFSALTFPLVISAVALKSSLVQLSPSSPLCFLFYFEMTLATLVVSKVFLGYLKYFRE